MMIGTATVRVLVEDQLATGARQRLVDGESGQAIVIGVARVEDVNVVVGGEGGIDGDRVEALFEKLPPMLVICRNGAGRSACTAVMPAGLLRRVRRPAAPPGRNAIVVGRLRPVVRISFWK